jgi:energy-coupling factor transporter ATP-binding protein EcfA2
MSGSKGSAEPLLSVKGLVAGYGSVEVLHEVSLEVREGEIVTLIGGNGAGKSTTLMCISRIHRAAGRIEFAGEDLSRLAPEQVVRRGSLAERVAEAQKEKAAAERYEAAASKRLADWRLRHGDDALRTAPDRAAVVAQEERLKAAQAALDRLILRAPLAGLVTTLVVGVGDAVSEGQVLVAVMDGVASQATAWVPEESAWRVHPGDIARLRSVDGRSASLQGRVRALGGGILEGPARLRQLPGEPLFGRAVYIDLDPLPVVGADGGSPAPLPGQTYEASFVSERKR